MADIPALATLYDGILKNLESELSINIPLFGKSFLRALAAVQAAKLKLYYLAIANLQKNIWVDTAERESIGGTLERFGRVKLNRNPNSAIAGQYTVSIVATGSATINVNTTFKSDDNSTNPGELYIVDTTVAIAVAGTYTFNIRALKKGTDSRLVVGDTLTPTAPIINVNEQCKVTVEVVTPAPEEDIETYRNIIIESFRLSAQGGSGGDYRRWSKEVAGVKEAFVYARSGYANEVEVFIESTIITSTDGRGTPPASMLTSVETVLETNPDVTLPSYARARRPIGLNYVKVTAITPKDIDIYIVGYENLTAAKQTTISNAIQSILSEIRPYIASCDIDNVNDIFDNNKAISTIFQAVPSSLFDSLYFKIAGTIETTFKFQNGNIPYLNSVNYV